MSPHSLLPHLHLPPAICVHSGGQANLALAAKRPVTLLSARAAAVFAGPAWWRALIAGSGTTQPDILDCADASGRALEAIALRCRIIILAACPAWPEIAERAESAGSILLTTRPPNLDLADPVAVRHIEAWLEVG